MIKIFKKLFKKIFQRQAQPPNNTTQKTGIKQYRHYQVKKTADKTYIIQINKPIIIFECKPFIPTVQEVQKNFVDIVRKNGI